VVKSVVKEIEYKLDVNSLQKDYEPSTVGERYIKVTIKTASPVSFDSYKQLRVNGGAILIDETSLCDGRRLHDTVAPTHKHNNYERKAFIQELFQRTASISAAFR